MSDPVASLLLRRAGGSLLVSFIAVLLVGALLTCAGLGAAFAPRGMGVVVFGVLFGGIVLLLPPLAIGFAIWRSRVLDAELGAMGLVGSGWVPNLREYHGTVDGRRVDVLYARRGPMLQVTVDADVHTAVGVGTRTTLGAALGGLVAEPEVPGRPEAFAPYIVRAREPEWATPVLAMPPVATELLALVADPSGREVRSVALRPGAIQVTRSYFRAPPEGVTAQIEAMLRLAAAVEKAPPPRTRMEASALERGARTNPTRLGAIIAFVLIFGIMGATGVVVVAALMLAATHR